PAGAVGGDFTISWDADFPKPANDDFADAFALGGESTGGHAYNMTATKETGEPNHAGNAGGGSLWWTWTAPQSGTAALVIQGQGFDVLAAVYTGGAVDALVPVTSASGTSVTSSFVAVEGTTYHIAIDGLHGATGYVDFELSLAPSFLEPEFSAWSFEDGLLTGVLFGEAGADYVLQISSNLIHWQTFFSPTNNNGTSPFSVSPPSVSDVYFLRGGLNP
ncbi:MAG TPA: hypothetical protein PKE55_14255, partial [Kiritimatiellia bacterium]|nr:hypothetical protein [Kiritimatiellia bacterium]